MAKIVGRGGYLGTNSNSWRVVANGVFDGIWFSNEQHQKLYANNQR